jgi:hypothetical protein
LLNSISSTGVAWCEGGTFHPVVDGVGPRLTRAPFLGWGSGVAVESLTLRRNKQTCLFAVTTPTFQLIFSQKTTQQI